MQISYYPMKSVWVSGSETANSHRGTYNLDIVCPEDPFVYAPFDCKIVNIYHSPSMNSNTTWFESLEPVKGKSFTDYVTFVMGHIDDAEFLRLGLKIGKVFKQGEVCYRVGTQGNVTGPHIHTGWARGKFVAPGWKVNSLGNWAIINQVHMWDALFLKPGTKILGSTNEAGYAYRLNWAYATTPAVMADVTLKGLQTTDVAVNVRSLPSTFYPIVGVLAKDTLYPITQVSTNAVDGFFWVKTELGYVAKVASVSVVDILTPEQELQRQLDEANKVIAEQNAQITTLTNDLTTATNELNSFTTVSTVLYEKK